MNELSPIWCPHCKCRAMVIRFLNNKCPQCSKDVPDGHALRSDPFNFNKNVTERRIKRIEQYEDKDGKPTY